MAFCVNILPFLRSDDRIESRDGRFYEAHILLWALTVTVEILLRLFFFVSSRKSTGSLDPVKLGGGGGGGGSAGNNRGGGPTPGKETKLLVLCVIISTTTFTINRYSTDNYLFPVPTHLAL